jgi:molybdopterin-guanine dinucleotide biosynthesis protein A
MRILAIIAAGNSTRFIHPKKKPFAHIVDDVTTVNFIIGNALSIFNRIVVVLSSENDFAGILDKFPEVIPVVQKDVNGNSGAVLLALKSIKTLGISVSTFVVQWVDQPFYFKTDYQKLLGVRSDILIPCIVTKNPYVCWVFKNENLVQVTESRATGFVEAFGIQDGGLFVFRGNRIEELEALLNLQVDGMNSAEQNLIYLFPKLNIERNNIYFNNNWYNFLNYNTVEDFDFLKFTLKFIY